MNQGLQQRYSLPFCSVPFEVQRMNHPNIIYATQALQNINCIEEACEGYGALFLGDIISVMKKELLKKYSIEAILSCMTEFQNSLDLSRSIHHKIIPVKDSLQYPIGIHFEDTFNFIEQMRKQGRNVLVHCHAGVSRSVSIICAYLMKKNGWDFHYTFNYLKQRKNRIRPNQNFVNILKQFENNIFSTPKKQNLIIKGRKNALNFSTVDQPNIELRNKSLNNISDFSTNLKVSEITPKTRLKRKGIFNTFRKSTEQSSLHLQNPQEIHLYNPQNKQYSYNSARYTQKDQSFNNCFHKLLRRNAINQLGGNHKLKQKKLIQTKQFKVQGEEPNCFC